MDSSRPCTFKAKIDGQSGKAAIVQATRFSSERIVEVRIRDGLTRRRRETQITFTLRQAKAAIVALQAAVAASEEAE